MAKVLRAEPTPNPNAVKLIFDQKLTIGGSRNYTKKDDAFDSPLAQQIFDIHGVEAVFLNEDAVTISKTPGGIWDFIFSKVNEVVVAMKVIEVIKSSQESKSSEILAPGDFDKMTQEQKLSLIDRVIDETIRPGLARDGGGLKILGLDNNVLMVRYQGACGSCPSATAQTLHYISNMLQSRVSPNLTVVPA